MGKFKNNNLCCKNFSTFEGSRESWETVGKKLWKRIYAQGMLLLQRSRKKNYFNFLYFGCATQDKALGRMKLVSKIFFFIKEFMV